MPLSTKLYSIGGRGRQKKGGTNLPQIGSRSVFDAIWVQVGPGCTRDNRDPAQWAGSLLSFNIC